MRLAQSPVDSPAAQRIVMALGIKQVEARLLRWRPEYQRR
jgi:hypothetical protein